MNSNTGWGAEKLTREELVTLANKLHNGAKASLRQASTPGRSAGRAMDHFAAAVEISHLWGDVSDQLTVRRPDRAAETEPEAEL